MLAAMIFSFPFFVKTTKNSPKKSIQNIPSITHDKKLQLGFSKTFFFATYFPCFLASFLQIIFCS